MNNNPEWDSLWKKSSVMPSKFMGFHHFRIFSSYKKILDSLGLKNPKVIELGCGSGELTAAIVERYGGEAALLDSSEAALKIAEDIFRKRGIPCKILMEDLLNFKPKEKYDIVHSEGLIEHFTGKEQKKVLEVHRECASGGGFVLISVPRKVWYYSASRKFLGKIGKWPFGDEKPMDAKALKSLLEQNGLAVRESFNSGRFAFALAVPSKK